MYAFKMLLLSAVSLLGFTSVDFATATVYKCRMPAQFSMENADHSMIDFYESRLSVSLPNENYLILTYPESETITFTIPNVVVNFIGNVIFSPPGYISALTKLVVQTLGGRISGVAQRKIINDTDSNISDCHVYLLPVQGDSGNNDSIEIANDIRSVAEACVHSLICQKLGKLNTHYRMVTTHPKSLALLPGLTSPNHYIKSHSGPSPVQHAFNEIVDQGLKRLASLEPTQIRLPKIFHRFTRIGGAEPQVYMMALNGTFGDLTALKRTSTPTVSHEGLRFIITSNFSINAPKVHYQYMMHQDRGESMGEMTATFDSVDLLGSSMADYSVTPCRLSLENLEVTNFRNVNHRLRNFAGVKTMPTTKNWFDKYVVGVIHHSIEKHLRYILRIYMLNTDCERYRP